MIKNHLHQNNRPSLRAGLLSAAAALLFAWASPVSAQTYTYTGASTVSSNWSDPANWTVSPTSVTSTVPPTGLTTGLYLYFPATNSSGVTYTNFITTNDITSLAGVSGIAVASSNSSFYGQVVTVGNGGNNMYFTNWFPGLPNGGNPATVAASNYWDIPFNLQGDLVIVQNTHNNNGTALVFAGLLSGTAEVVSFSDSSGQGHVYILGANTYTGQKQSYTQNPNLNGAFELLGGFFYFDTMSPSNVASSFGQYSSTRTTVGNNACCVGPYYSGAQVQMHYIGTNNATTDMPWRWETSPTYQGDSHSFYNDSPSNANLTFAPSANASAQWTGVSTTGNGSTLYSWTINLLGTSTGTNTFAGNFMQGAALTATINGVHQTGIVPVGLNISGPGTWVFSGPMNQLSNNETIVSGATVAIQSNQVMWTPQVTLNSGCVLDLSWNDANSLAPYMFGSNAVETLIAGRPGNATGIDIIGSLGLATSEVTNGATLNVAGVGTIGTLTISGSFVPAGGAIAYDLTTNNTTGSGSNDLIVVNGNLDLSQGIANIQTTATAVKIGVPYVLMTYAGTLTPHAAGSPGLNVVAPTGFKGTVSTATANEIVVTFGPSGIGASNLVWTGSSSGNWDLSDENWIYQDNPSQATYFLNSDPVLFDDTDNAGGQFTVNIFGGNVTTGPIIVSNNVNPYTISSTTGSGITSGSSGTLTKEGTSSLTLATANAFNAPVVISAGSIIAYNSAAFGTQTITMGDANTGTNQPTLLDGGFDLSHGTAITVTSNCVNGAVIGSDGNGMCNFSTITLDNPTASPYALILNTGTGGPRLEMGPINGTTANVLVIGDGGYAELTGGASFSGSITVEATNTSYTELKTDGALAGDIDLDLTTNTTLLVTGTQAGFDAVNGPGNSIIMNHGGAFVSVTTLTIGTGGHSGEFDGQIKLNGVEVAGSCINIVKAGAGTEIFTGDNSAMDGTNEIAGGILEANGSGTSSLPMGPVTVDAAGTLAGNGTVQTDTNYDITVNGTLLVGAPTDTTGTMLRLANSTGNGYLALNGTLAVNVYSGAGAGDNSFNSSAAGQLNVNLPVTLGGASVLAIGNPNSLSGFKVGDKWTVIAWNGFRPTNTFASVIMPTLPGSLALDTSSLYTSGVIEIVAGSAQPTEPASITSVSKSGANMIFNGTNLAGAGSGFHYVVLSSTTLNKPLASWTPVATNGFNANGSFSFTNAIGAGALYYTTKVVQ